MRRSLVAVLLALIPFGSVAQDSPMKPDGRMWAMYGSASSQGMLIKGAYVQGAVEGLQAGATVGYFQGRNDEGDDFVDYVEQCAADKGRACPEIPERLTKPEALLKEAMARADKVRGKLAPQNGVSVLDIVRQMDKFYSDYRNTPVCMMVAVQESISSLRETAMSEQQLQLVRRGCNQ